MEAYVGFKFPLAILLGDDIFNDHSSGKECKSVYSTEGMLIYLFIATHFSFAQGWRSFLSFLIPNFSFFFMLFSILIPPLLSNIRQVQFHSWTSN